MYAALMCGYCYGMHRGRRELMSGGVDLRERTVSEGEVDSGDGARWCRGGSS